MPDAKSIPSLFQVGSMNAGKIIIPGRWVGGDQIKFLTHGNTTVKLPLVSPEPSDDAALAGEIGELIQGVVASGSGIDLTTGVVANVTSIDLTAGDWNVFGQVIILGVSGTTLTVLTGGSSLTTAAVEEANSFFWRGASFALDANKFGFTIPVRRVAVSSLGPGTTTVYLVAQATFAVSTLKAFGRISARRAR
jgi:hypothetical protein